MGSPWVERLGAFAPAGLGSVAVETGTCKGYGAEALAPFFSRVITIELSEELYRFSRDRLAPVPNVECRHGSSPEVLRELLPSLSPADGVFFFLDAHWSGDRTVPWEKSKWKGYGHDTAHSGRGALPSGPEQCPLAEELRVIVRECRGPACILIDDARSVGKRDAGFPGEDWSHLTRELLLEIVGPRLEGFRELERPSQWFLRLIQR